MPPVKIPRREHSYPLFTYSFSKPALPAPRSPPRRQSPRSQRFGTISIPTRQAELSTLTLPPHPGPHIKVISPQHSDPGLLLAFGET
jgi:hypothetical protein